MPHPTTLARRKMREEDPERYEEFRRKQRERDNRRNAEKRNAWEEESHTRAQVKQRQEQLEARRARERERYQAKKQAAKRKTRTSAAGSSTSPIGKRPRDMTPDEYRSYRAQQKRLQRSRLSYQKKAAIRKKRREKRQQERAEKLLPPISVTCEAEPCGTNKVSHKAQQERLQRSRLSYQKKTAIRKKRKEKRQQEKAEKLLPPIPSVTCEAGPCGTNKVRQSLYNLNHETAIKLEASSKEYAQGVLNLLNPKTPDKRQASQEEPHQSTLARRKMKEEDPERYEEFRRKQRERDNRRNAEKRNAWEEETHTRAQVKQRQEQLEAKSARDRERYQAKKQAAEGKTRASAASSSTSPTGKRPRDMTPDEYRSYRTQQKPLQKSRLSYQKNAAIRIKRKEKSQQERAEKLLPPILSVTSEAEPCGTNKLRQSLYNLNHETAIKLEASSEEYAQDVLNLLNPKTPDKRQASQEEPHQSTLARRKMKEEDPERYEEFRRKQRERDNRRNAEKRNAWEEEPHTRAQVKHRQEQLEAKRARDRERYQAKKQAAEGKTRTSAAGSSTSPTGKRPRDMTPDEYRSYRAQQKRLQRSRLSYLKKAAISAETILNETFVEAKANSFTNEIPDKQCPKVGDYVKLTCQINKAQKIYYAVVTSVTSEQCFSVRFLQKSRRKYSLGEHDDECLITHGPPDYYTWRVITPEECSLDHRGHYSFSV